MSQEFVSGYVFQRDSFNKDICVQTAETAVRVFVHVVPYMNEGKYENRFQLFFYDEWIEEVLMSFCPICDPDTLLERYFEDKPGLKGDWKRVF